MTTRCRECEAIELECRRASFEYWSNSNRRRCAAAIFSRPSALMVRLPGLAGCRHSLSTKSRLLPLCFSSEHCSANLIYLTAPSQLKTAHPLANTW